ncbi:hypothetical protein POG23_04705, partial [Limnoraphis robusta]|nr:hypothetical protein [Limnoraphis robusta]
MVEREVAFPNSNSKPCLILSHHTAPDVDTPFDIGNRVTTSCFVTSTFRAIAKNRKVRTYNGKDIYRRPKMPAPYSYDLRQKVINAIELDGIP